MLDGIRTHQLDRPLLLPCVGNKTFYQRSSNALSTVIGVDKDPFNNDPVRVAIDSGKTDLADEWLVGVTSYNPVILNLIIHVITSIHYLIFDKVIIKVKP